MEKKERISRKWKEVQFWSRIVARRSGHGVELFSRKAWIHIPSEFRQIWRDYLDWSQEICLKSDGGSSIKAFKDVVKYAGELNAGVEVSPVWDSKAHQEIERAVKTDQGQVRSRTSTNPQKCPGWTLWNKFQWGSRSFTMVDCLRFVTSKQVCHWHWWQNLTWTRKGEEV